MLDGKTKQIFLDGRRKTKKDGRREGQTKIITWTHFSLEPKTDTIIMSISAGERGLYASKTGTTVALFTRFRLNRHLSYMDLKKTNKFLNTSVVWRSFFQLSKKTKGLTDMTCLTTCLTTTSRFHLSLTLSLPLSCCPWFDLSHTHTLTHAHI